MTNKKELILVNGNVTEQKDVSIPLSNRCYKYGDGLFETIRVADGFPLFYRTHHSRLVRGLDALGMVIPEQFSFIYFKERLLELIEVTAVKNGTIRVQAYRSGEGKYTPESASFEWIAEISESPNASQEFYEFPNDDYRIGIYGELKKQPNQLSFFKSSNAQLYVQAGLFAKRNDLDNVLIENTNGYCIETIAENLFIFKNGIVVFPPVSDGPIEGVMRAMVKKLLIWNKIDFKEKSLTLQEIKEADELFLTNVNKGILPVTHLQDKTYETNFVIGLQAKLNERVANILANRAKH